MAVKLKPALQSSASGRWSAWSGASLVNCFAEKADGDKRDDFAVMAIPGLTVLGTTGSGPHRGSQMMGGTLYVVSGNYLYSVASDWTATQLGPIFGTGPVRMAANYSEVAIVDSDGTGYVYSGGVLTPGVMSDVADVIYFDGYMVWLYKDSEQFIISALDDALTYDGLDIASVEGAPDNVVGMVNSHRELLFLGGTSTEVWYNSGNFDFPFDRQGNSFVERGCFDRDSIIKIDNSVMFMGDDRIVYTMDGYRPQRLSTHFVEYKLRDATYARAWTYAQEGHLFYVLECDAGTLVYDRATGAWHQRQSYEMDHWRAYGAVQAYDQTVMFDRANGNIYQPSLDVGTENGSPIITELQLPTIEGDRERMLMHSFEIALEAGVGTASAVDPQIMLQYSDDGGHRWSNEMWRSMGRVGEYRTRAVWRRLGHFRQRQMKVRISDPVKRLVISCWADIG